MKTRVIGATEFKAKCLALLDEIDEHGGTITVTKRGRPVATLSAAKKPVWKSPAGILAGKGKISRRYRQFRHFGSVGCAAARLGSGLLNPRFLLDTHIVVRWLYEPKKLSREQHRVLDEAVRRGECVGVSAFSLD